MTNFFLDPSYLQNDPKGFLASAEQIVDHFGQTRDQAALTAEPLRTKQECGALADEIANLPEPLSLEAKIKLLGRFYAGLTPIELRAWTKEHAAKALPTLAFRLAGEDLARASALKSKMPWRNLQMINQQIVTILSVSKNHTAFFSGYQKALEASFDSDPAATLLFLTALKPNYRSNCAPLTQLYPAFIDEAGKRCLPEKADVFIDVIAGAAEGLLLNGHKGDAQKIRKKGAVLYVEALLDAAKRDDSQAFETCAAQGPKMVELAGKKCDAWQPLSRAQQRKIGLF